jgi:hypothetical protein
MRLQMKAGRWEIRCQLDDPLVRRRVLVRPMNTPCRVDAGMVTMENSWKNACRKTSPHSLGQRPSQASVHRRLLVDAGVITMKTSWTSAIATSAARHMTHRGNGQVKIWFTGGTCRAYTHGERMRLRYPPRLHTVLRGTKNPG